jgi:tetratricopeptide (TPR) repeat protein
VAGLLAALYRPFLLYEDFLLTETLVVFLAALGLVACFAADRARLAAARGVKRRHLLAGFVLGLGLLARPTLLPLAALVWFAAGTRRNALVALLGVALAIAPVTLRNWAAGGSPVLITAHGGETFYVGNRPGADGSNLQPAFVRSGPATEHEDYRREASRRLGHDVDLVASSRYWRNEAFRWITAHPGDWLRLVGKKLSLLLHAYEKGDNEDPEAARRLVPLERLPLPGFALACALGVLGIAAGFAHRGAGPELRRPRVLLGLACLALAAGCLLYFVTARYRLPLAVPLLACAGYGAATLAALAAPPRAMRRLLPAAALVAAVLLALHRPLPARYLNDPAITAVNLGYLLEAGGDIDGAIDSYRRALAADPRFALAHFNLGVAERRRGELAAAEAAFRQALALDPDYADALDQLAMTLEQGGERDSSLALYRRAIAIDSTRARYFKDLGRLHILRGEPEAALLAWAQALALDPADSTTARRARLLEKELFLGAAPADSLRGGEPR